MVIFSKTPDFPVRFLYVYRRLHPHSFSNRGINALSASLMDTVGTWIGDFQTSIDAFLLVPRLSMIWEDPLGFFTEKYIEILKILYRWRLIAEI